MITVPTLSIRPNIPNSLYIDSLNESLFDTSYMNEYMLLDKKNRSIDVLIKYSNILNSADPYNTMKNILTSVHNSVVKYKNNFMNKIDILYKSFIEDDNIDSIDYYVTEPYYDFISNDYSWRNTTRMFHRFIDNPYHYQKVIDLVYNRMIEEPYNTGSSESFTYSIDCINLIVLNNKFIYKSLNIVNPYPYTYYKIIDHEHELLYMFINSDYSNLSSINKLYKTVDFNIDYNSIIDFESFILELKFKYMDCLNNITLERCKNIITNKVF